MVCTGVESPPLGPDLLYARIEESPDVRLRDFVTSFCKRAEVLHEVVPGTQESFSTAHDRTGVLSLTALH